MLMPDFRVTLPTTYRLSLLSFGFILAVCLNSPAQGPRILPKRTTQISAAKPVISRVARRSVPIADSPAAATVTISRAEYERLKLAAKSAARRAAVNDVSAIVTEAHYTVTVENRVARIRCRFVIRALQGPWAKIPIDFGHAAVGTLTAEKGDSAFLQGTGNGKFVLNVKGPGTSGI